MSDMPEAVAQKRDYYLLIMQKAQQLNDQKLIKLVMRKLARLGMARVDYTTSGCAVIPFPSGHYPVKFNEYERPSWWLFFKLTLAIPGSLLALLLLAHYRWGPGI